MLVLSLKKHLTLKTFRKFKTDLVRLLYKFIASQKRPHYDTFIRIRAYKNLELRPRWRKEDWRCETTAAKMLFPRAESSSVKIKGHHLCESAWTP